MQKYITTKKIIIKQNIKNVLLYKNNNTQPPEFTTTSGVIPDMEDKSPIDFFRLLFSGQVLDLIYRETQRYIDQYREREKEYIIKFMY